MGDGFAYRLMVHLSWRTNDRPEQKRVEPELMRAKGSEVALSVHVLRARELVPVWAERALAAERARRPADESIRELGESGVLALLVPRVFGGEEADLETFCEVVGTLGEGCTSTAWVAAFYIAHSWIAALFPEAAQRELFAQRPWIQAPAVLAATGGQARPEGDGFRLSGRWSWATGITHADWVFAGAQVLRSDATGEVRMFAVPAEAVQVDDVWFTDGMRATGSNDVRIHDVWVPAHRTLDMRDLALATAPGSKLHPNPLYRLPFIPFLALVAALPAVGTVRAAVRGYQEQVRSRLVHLSSARQQDQAAVQMRLARVTQTAATAELLLRQVAIDLQALGRVQAVADAVDRGRLRMMATAAVGLCRDGVRLLSDSAGASTHLENHPLQRAARDLSTLASHVIFDADATAEVYGRVLLGLPPGTALL